MKLTRHNGRSGKHGTYNPRHNDRRFDVENSEHIDAERARQNVYWDCYRGFTTHDFRENPEQPDFSFEEIERMYYYEHYADHVNAQNARNEKKIGKALEAHVVLYPQGDEGKRAMEKLSAFTTDQLADLFIVSDVEIAQGAGAAGVKVPGIQAAVSEAKGEKCERCWKHHIKVGSDTEHPTLCPRCAKVIRTIQL